MSRISFLFIINLLLFSNGHSQSIIDKYQVGTAGNDFLGNLKFNDYWGTILSGEVDGFLTIYSTPIFWSGGIIIYIDSTVNFLTFGDNLPDYDLTSVKHSPTFVFGSDDQIYLCGYAEDTIRMGIINLYSGHDSLTFFANILPAGWAASKPLAENIIVTDMAIYDNTDIFLTGKIKGTSKYDLGFTTHLTYIPSDTSNICLLKLDTNARVVWFKDFGGSGILEDAGNAISTDKSGNVYFTGHIGTNTSFDSIYLPLHNSNQYEGFIAKCNPFGIIEWVKYAGEDALDVEVDSLGNCYVGGYAGDSAWFGDSLIINNFLRNLFIAKYDSTGNLLWVLSNNSPGHSQVNSLKLNDRFCYATGSFSDSLTVGNLNYHSSLCPPDSNMNAFIICVDEYGNMVFGKTLTSCQASSVGMSIDVDDCKVISCGFINDTTNPIFFDTDSMVSVGESDGYFFTVDSCLVTSISSDFINEDKQIEGYPNPTSGEFYINNAKLGERISIKDMFGRVWYSKLITDANFSIDLSNFKSGVYIASCGNNIPMKIIKV